MPVNNSYLNRKLVTKRTMKSILLVITLIFAGISLSFTHDQKPQEWIALSEMKALMKQTFPPLMKNNDLEPARKNAAQMVVLAKNLQNGEKPKAFRSKEMALKFESITKNAEELVKLVEKNASDEEVKIALSILHGSFAEIAHHKKAGHKNHS